MADYVPTIGLEIHVELKTSTKMFCSSKNDPDEDRPNVNVCPVCMAFPGTLPVVNQKAVQHVLAVGTALGSELADYTEFDRKNYFYPDIPKGYQISQYEFPLVKGGTLAGVTITRIHLEEDTANSKHVGESSLVDFNRAGIPLMELVTEPVIHDAATASNFAKELQLLLRTLGASDANIEKGQMRVEVNISVSRDETLGTKTEVKNIGSFKSVERAIAFEIERQIKTLEEGGTLVQETRGFDEERGVTYSQRLKESSHDYRYFPDPDIPKFKMSLVKGYSKEELGLTLPELPWQKRERLLADGIRAEDVEVLLNDENYETIHAKEIAPMEAGKAKEIAINLLMGDVRSRNQDQIKLTNLIGTLSVLSVMSAAGELSSSATKTVIGEMLANGGDPKQIAKEMGLMQISDTGALEGIVAEIIAENPKVAEEYKAGKVEVMQFLIGQGMKKSKGAAKPELLKELIHKKLS